jgi:hypothetical protein
MTKANTISLSLKGWNNVMFVAFIIPAFFFVYAAILMVTWNYSVPRIVESVDTDFTRSTDFKDMDYVQAMVVSVLIMLVFGSGYFLSFTPKVFASLQV